jgi:hypothetical protein
MSANDYHCPTDEELSEREITKLFKAYKIDRIQRPLPLHIKEDIARVLENIGWSCWFADWLNHRIYCWILEINATSSKPNLEEFIYFEDIPSDSESEEDEEDDKCKYCGWRSEYPESHILYCGGSGCEYIKNKYNTWINEDGEMEWKLRDEEEEVIERLAENDFNIKNGK